MADITKALSAKANKILDKQMNYRRFGILTRRQFCEKMLELGAVPKVLQVQAVQYNRRKFNNMDYAEQREYNKKLENTKPEYQLYYADDPSCCAVVTKTEYDYFIDLLSEKQDKEEIEEFNALPESDRNAIESLFTGSYKA